MSSQDADNPKARTFWASPGWLRLWDGMLAGLRHDVTGRVSALNSLSIVASRGLAQGEMIIEELARESGKLAELARVLDAFPTTVKPRVIGVSLSDALAKVPELVGLLNEFRDANIRIDLPGTLPAVVLDVGPAKAAILLSVAQALEYSSVGACRVTATAVGSAADQVAVTVSALESSGLEASGPWLCEESIQGIVALARAWGGDFAVDADKGKFTLTAPTL